MNVVRAFTEDPQWLIDNEIEFQFKEIEGHAKMVDGIAAGEEFIGFQFVSGPHAKKTIYCSVLEDTKWYYETKISSDGFQFNGDDEESDGDFVPELNGKILTLKK